MMAKNIIDWNDVYDKLPKLNQDPIKWNCSELCEFLKKNGLSNACSALSEYLIISK